MRTPGKVALVAFVIAAGIAAAGWALRVEPPSPDRAERAAVLRAEAPAADRAEIERRLDASDELRARDEEVDVIALLREVEVTEDELRAFHASHPEIFGERSFEQSRISVDQLVRVEKVRSQLNLPPGEHLGAHGPS